MKIKLLMGSILIMMIIGGLGTIAFLALSRMIQHTLSPVEEAQQLLQSLQSG